MNAIQAISKIVVNPTSVHLHLLYARAKNWAEPHAQTLHRWGYTANQVSFTRAISAPTLILLIDFTFGVDHWFTALILSILIGVLAYTDLLDGLMARFEDKPITDWGGTLDSLADKFMVLAAYLIMYRYFPATATVTMVGEALLATLAITHIIKAGRVTEQVVANIGGKTKVVFEVATILLMFAYIQSQWATLHVLALLTGWIAIFFLIVSLSIKVIKTTKPAEPADN